MAHGGQVWQGRGPEAWLDFSANIRPEGAPDWVREALALGGQYVGYYPDIRMDAPREGLALGLGIPPECVLPTPGGAAAIDLACRAATGDALVLDPAFAEYERAAKRRGRGVMRAPYGEMGAVKKALFPGATVWLNNPNNPTGSAWDRPRIIKLLEATESAGGTLIVDEAFIWYCPQHSVADLVAAHPALIVVGSLTKILGIPGARLGYICAHPDIITKIEVFVLPWHLNCYAAAVASAFGFYPAASEQEQKTNEGRRAWLTKALSSLGAYVYPSEANFVLISMMRYAETIAGRLKDRGLLVRQCMDFKGVDDGFHLRLAIKDQPENERLVRELEAVL